MQNKSSKNNLLQILNFGLLITNNHNNCFGNVVTIFHVLILLVFIISSIAVSQPGDTSSAGKIKFYLDADMTGTQASGISIKRGIQTALSEIDYHLAGYDIELVVLDHRGNSRRSLSHLKKYCSDSTALAVFTGLHSPPLLSNLKYIHENEILILDPWAAAGPITRYQSDTNWVFRLSIDDSKAGNVIVNFAIDQGGLRFPVLLLEKTGWGESNELTMTRALKKHGLDPSAVIWFNWGLSHEAARIYWREISQLNADGVLLVANAPEAKTIIRAMLSLPHEYHLPIFSHWGITGGNFPESLGPDTLSQLSLYFIQTSFSFMDGEQNEFSAGVLTKAIKLFPDEITGPADITAPTGFIHAYDLAQILITAITEIGLTGQIEKDRRRIRYQLENLRSPVKGLIKIYNRPFAKYNLNTPDAHEALNEDDFVMGSYKASGEIVIIR